MADKTRQALANFRVWQSERKDRLKVPCRNRYGNIAFFEDHDGVIRIGFGDEDGFEPDKDALAFDKEDLPDVIAFLQKALERASKTT